MIRDYEKEVKNRVAFIRDILSFTKADGIVFGNSGGKDSALVGILSKMACDNVLGVMMPCGSQQNYHQDYEEALIVAKEYGIDSKVVDLTPVKASLEKELSQVSTLSASGVNNMAPRLRMNCLYAIAVSENKIVAGTSNRSEIYMGYFTKWGDGGCDFNPISDLTVQEVYEMLKYLKAPSFLLTKPPSAGLFDGQTDEADMGITYQKIDNFLLNGEASKEDQMILNRYHRLTEHKRNFPYTYENSAFNVEKIK